MIRVVLIFLLLLSSPALAHDKMRPELDQWFSRLQSARGLCCSFADGFAVSDVDWESRTATIESASRISGSMFPTTP